MGWCVYNTNQNIMNTIQHKHHDIEMGIHTIVTEVHNPINHSTTLVYSPFVPDIEIDSKVGDLINTMNGMQKEQTNRLNHIEEKLEKLQNDFYVTITYRLSDCCISVILWVVIYVKVFVGFN